MVEANAGTGAGLGVREALLRQVMAYLQLPAAPEVGRPQDLLAWAVRHWDMAKVPKAAIATE